MQQQPRSFEVIRGAPRDLSPLSKTASCGSETLRRVGSATSASTSRLAMQRLSEKERVRARYLFAHRNGGIGPREYGQFALELQNTKARGGKMSRQCRYADELVGYFRSDVVGA